ncbi:MAG: spore coat protein CotJB [Thermoflavifilum sp.]|nr:spore coat protein CotJB [Thermoflavifilum sp.]MCL6512791.1 spore coat protein CotJB [Alicyclobacillus sp.]
MTKLVPKEYEQLMQELQALDFVLVELTLYLDTHPDDEQALAEFGQFARRRAAVAHQFESRFGPLLEFGRGPAPARWTWCEGPWPWQV